ncbi:MAG: recombination regulator RecX [Proteobacteria bacterium]|nr:recombination regulator RecX [Pseudomonadota bacterium]
MKMSKPDLETLRAMMANKAAGENRSLVSSDSALPEEKVVPATAPSHSRNKKPPSLRSKALQYLARRDYARAELRQKLLLLSEDAEEVEALLEDFSARGWLSDTRFAEQWTHQRGSRYGAQRLKQELRMKGVAEETIATALEEIADGEEARARAIWQRKFGALPADMNERARQVRFLAARGFSLDIAYKITGSLDE